MSVGLVNSGSRGRVDFSRQVKGTCPPASRSRDGCQAAPPLRRRVMWGCAGSAAAGIGESGEINRGLGSEAITLSYFWLSATPSGSTPVRRSRTRGTHKHAAAFSGRQTEVDPQPKSPPLDLHSGLPMLAEASSWRAVVTLRSPLAPPHPRAERS